MNRGTEHLRRKLFRRKNRCGKIQEWKRPSGEKTRVEKTGAKDLVGKRPMGEWTGVEETGGKRPIGKDRGEKA